MLFKNYFAHVIFSDESESKDEDEEAKLNAAVRYLTFVSLYVTIHTGLKSYFRLEQLLLVLGCRSLMLCLVYSAPADASTEDATAHATGNGVASEVGHILLRLYLFIYFLFLAVPLINYNVSLPPPLLFRPQVRLQVRTLTVTATVMMMTMMSASPLATLKLERHSTRRFSVSGC